MAIRPHIKLNTQKQKEQAVKLKFNYGFPDEDEQPDTPNPNYYMMARAFRSYLPRYENDVQERNRQRKPEIQVPEHIDYILILFQSQFDIGGYYKQWYEEFGLLGINFSKFNNEILFAISDREKFQVFLNNVTSFIQRESGENPEENYSGKIRYVKEFKLLSTADIIQYRQAGALMNFKLADFPLDSKSVQAIYVALQKYLEDNQIGYSLGEDSKNLEVYNATDNQIVEIVQNFDIVLSVTSSLATVIKPTEFNLPERSYGFEISNAMDELPIIGVIDTGISKQTPLASILMADEGFNITGSGALEDNIDNGSGHGTAVAALAALGKKAYRQGYKGAITADAKLLSIKVLDDSSGFLSQQKVLELLHKAKQKYPSIKVFVLTICYETCKRNNEDYSSYAYELDKFAYENDCIITICTANNNDAVNRNSFYDLNYFLTEATNLCTPAESMNNITVGAAAHSLRQGNHEGISTSKEYPTLYTRKSHIDLHALFPKTKINKLYFKPDVIDCGGDYEHDRSNTFIGAGAKASMEVLSANPTESFYSHIGTSFSAPLVANIAAQIQKNYPDIKSQSIKALIVNSSSLTLIRFQKSHSRLLNKTAGYGLVDEAKSVFSNDNQITLLVEDEIEPEQVKIIPLHFPKYLSQDDLGKKRGILQLTATLCFNFEPVMNHQLAYCPVHIAFCFFKNQTGDEILAKEDEIKSLLKSTLRWSQSARYKSKPIPYSNTQKISFPVNVQELIDESSTFKLAVNCRINPQLLPGGEKRYEKAHAFSIAITITENVPESRLTGKLYNEVMLCNEVENISVADLAVEGSAEAEV